MENINEISNNWKKKDLTYQSRLVFTSFKIRVFNLLIAILVAVIVRNFLEVNISKEAIIVYFAWLVTSSAYLLPFRPGIAKNVKWVEKIHFSYYFLGIFYATMLVHYLGGGEWVAVIVYFFDLIYANVLMRRSKGAIITLLIMAAYFSLIFLEYNGVLSHHTVFVPAEATFKSFNFIFATNLAIMGMFFFLISYSTGLFSRMKEDREKDLLESKNRFAIKSEQLEEIMLKLKKKVAENTYIKRAAMGFIQKKEFEIEKTKMELEDKLGKIRKTQKSMFFMIEDLNGMSSQLKETKDQLEEKVRVRSDELLRISGKLYRSERLAFLGKLAGSVTHELRNPLAVLKNAVYVLGTKLKGSKDEKIEYYIKMIEREIMLVDSIIEDIMGFAKTSPSEIAETDLAYLINNIISTLDIPDTLEVKTEFQEVSKVEIDPRQISHAFVNIANNAIMAMKGNGLLTFRVFDLDETVCVEIEDTGPGIPKD